MDFTNADPLLLCFSVGLQPYGIDLPVPEVFLAHKYPSNENTIDSDGLCHTMVNTPLAWVITSDPPVLMERFTPGIGVFVIASATTPRSVNRALAAKGRRRNRSAFI